MNRCLKRFRNLTMAHPSLALRATMFICIAFFAPTTCVRAELDPHTKTPYQLQVVLHIAPSRVFTPLFQEQLQRDVKNQLRLSFGRLAHVEVTHDHPLLHAIEAKGLDPAIEAWDALSERATHFVFVDHVAGTYQVRTRFQDGMTGQAGAFTQKALTSDRTAVAATIAKMIGASFSPVGTVTSVGKSIGLKLKGGDAVGQEVTLKLRGGELGEPMDRWVQRGHVFAVSQINAEGGRERAARLEWAVLEVVAVQAGGVCRCRYWHRYREDVLSERPPGQGFRALRLSTVQGPVKVQLLDDKTLQPPDGLRVRVQRLDLDSKPEEPIRNRAGLAITREAFAHLAWVQVLAGDEVRAQFPVELIEGRTVVVRAKTQPGSDTLPLEVRRDAWLNRVYDNVRISTERVTELSALLNQSLESALKAGRKRLPILEEEIRYLDREQDNLIQLAREKKWAFDPREGELQIEELRQRAKGLQAFILRIESVLKDPGSDQSLGLHKLLERARLAEVETDFDQAIRLYEQVVQASPEQASKIKAHLDKLKENWRLKGDAGSPEQKKHTLARDFFYKTWPTLDVAGVQKEIGKAKEHLAVCREAGDKLTPLKFLRVNAGLTVNLKKQLETLRRRDSEDNRNQAKILVQISGDLLRLHNEVVASVGTRKE